MYNLHNPYEVLIFGHLSETPEPQLILFEERATQQATESFRARLLHSLQYGKVACFEGADLIQKRQPDKKRS